MRLYFTVILICISLMINNVELLMCLLVMCMSSLKKKYIQVLCPFFNQAIYFLMLSCMSSCIFWILTLCQYHCNIFPHQVHKLFLLLIILFIVQKLFSLMQKKHLSVFTFVSFVWGDISKKYCWDLCQRAYFLCFITEVLWFKVLCLHL